MQCIIYVFILMCHCWGVYAIFESSNGDYSARSRLPCGGRPPKASSETVPGYPAPLLYILRPGNGILQFWWADVKVPTARCCYPTISAMATIYKDCSYSGMIRRIYIAQATAFPFSWIHYDIRTVQTCHHSDRFNQSHLARAECTVTHFWNLPVTSESCNTQMRIF